jgi:hypothetical protein
MTEMLKKAFERLSVLPIEDQEAIAQRILDEIDDELRWQKSFEESSELLERLADEAREEHRQGKTLPGDW